MSTKIHHGYRYQAPDGTHADPFALGQALRAALKPVVEAAYRAKVAEIATDIYDGIDSGVDTDDDRAADDPGRRPHPLLDAERRILDAGREIKATGRRNPALDFSCDVSILPDPDDPASLYLLTYCEQDIDEALCAVDGVDEYRYFNNVDRPAEHTEETWGERCETWERVLGSDAPVTRGLTWSLEQLEFSAALGNRDAFVAALPDTATRARRIAVHRAVTTVEIPDELRESGATFEIMELVTDARDAALADTDTIAEIAAGLRELTFDDLVGPVGAPA